MTAPCDPLAVILVGVSGDRLLFKFPYDHDDIKDTGFTGSTTGSRNPYAVRVSEDFSSRLAPHPSEAEDPMKAFDDKMLATLLAVKSQLCGQNFEVKINNVIFVGYPMVLRRGSNLEPSPKRDSSSSPMMGVNVVFALRATDMDRSTIRCYQELAKQLVLGLRHEEKRCRYLTQQKDEMIAIHDDIATMPEDSVESPYRQMLKKPILLCCQLEMIYEDLRDTGIVDLYINRWVHISFCLPNKVHMLRMPKNTGINLNIKPEVVTRAIGALKPFHAMLLLEAEDALLSSLPLDSSPSLHRLIRVQSPLKSLQNLASDADLSLGQVFQLVSHLVYWGKAIIIYPLCESNTYMLASNTNTYVNSQLVEDFVEQFPRMSLPAVLSDFSLPTSLGEHRDVLGLPQQQAQQVQMVVWLLRNHLLVQLHTYVMLISSKAAATSSVMSSSLSLSSSSLMSESMMAFRQRHSHNLSPLAEDPGSGRKMSASAVSDMDSANSEGSPSQSSITLTTTPSIEVANDGTVITKEVREQWRVQDSLLSNLTPVQRENALKVPATNNSDDLKLFSRLCPYFNGRHHLEEIMYYENVRRSQLLTLLDKFRSILITCQHEDDDISCWSERPTSEPGT